MEKSNAFLTSQKLREFSATNPALFVVQEQQQLLSSVQLCKPHGLQHARLPYPSLSPRVFSNSCFHWMMPSNHLILCHPLLLPSILPLIRVFSSESALCIRWPKSSSFSLSIIPSKEYSGLISFRIDWFDLAVQGILQHHRSIGSVLRCSAFFMIQLSHPHMITGKPTAFTRWTFVGRVMSVFFNTLFGFVTDFLPGTNIF